MHRILAISTILIVLSISSTFCQSMPRQRLGVSYFGEMAKHPGLAIDFSSNILPRNKSDIPASEVKHLLSGGLELSGYSHREIYKSISLTPRMHYQYLFKRGFMIGSSAGIGFTKQFNSGTTYEVDSQGDVTTVKNASRNKLNVNASITVGQNLMKQNNFPWGWNLDIGAFTESPSNSGFILHVFTKVGISYYLNVLKKK